MVLYFCYYRYQIIYRDLKLKHIGTQTNMFAIRINKSMLKMKIHYFLYLGGMYDVKF